MVSYNGVQDIECLVQFDQIQLAASNAPLNPFHGNPANRNGACMLSGRVISSYMSTAKEEAFEQSAVGHSNEGWRTFQFFLA